MPVLSFRDVTLTFAGRPPVQALNGVTFDAGRGRITALVGESGSGKSTLALAAMGLLPQGAKLGGSILLDDGKGPALDLVKLNPADPAFRAVRGGRIGLVFQEPLSAFSPVHTVGDQISEALRLQSAAALNHYLEEVHELGGELPLSDLLVRVTPQLLSLAEHSTDFSPQRADEPYRRALSGIYARLAATARILDQVEPIRHEIGSAAPYGNPDTLRADLKVLANSLKLNGSASLADGRLRRLLRAVQVFGFHLAPIDLRQNSEIHARSVAELLAGAGRCRRCARW